MLTPEQQDNLVKIAQAAVASELATGCPAALSASQAIFESFWLKHAPRENCFGIKAHGDLERQYLPTTEWLTDAQLSAFLAGDPKRSAVLRQTAQQKNGRKLYDCVDAFAAYQSLADCFADHARLIQSGVYEAAWKQYQADGNLDAYIAGISKYYASDPLYADKIKAEAKSSTVTWAIRNARALSSAQPLAVSD